MSVSIRGILTPINSNLEPFQKKERCVRCVKSHKKCVKNNIDEACQRCAHSGFKCIVVNSKKRELNNVKELTAQPASSEESSHHQSPTSSEDTFFGSDKDKDMPQKKKCRHSETDIGFPITAALIADFNVGFKKVTFNSQPDTVDEPQSATVQPPVADPVTELSANVKTDEPSATDSLVVVQTNEQPATVQPPVAVQVTDQTATIVELPATASPAVVQISEQPATVQPHLTNPVLVTFAVPKDDSLDKIFASLDPIMDLGDIRNFELES